tara:strand:- start:310 stop:585 length:276 start_codon:yes stop_codon:yes gene_type:complete
VIIENREGIKLKADTLFYLSIVKLPTLRNFSNFKRITFNSIHGSRFTVIASGLWRTEKDRFQQKEMGLSGMLVGWILLIFNHSTSDLLSII